MDGRMNGWTGRRMDGWTDVPMEGCTDGWMDGRTDGRMEGCTDGWMDGWIDGWMDSYIQFVGVHKDTITCASTMADVRIYRHGWGRDIDAYDMGVSTLFV